MQKNAKTYRSVSRYDYAAPLDAGRFLMGEQVIKELISTRAFNRLIKVRFLGAIDYVIVPFPNGHRNRYNRYQHSLGVTRLANMYAAQRDLSYEDRRIICVAALLHDIGHAPLSHSLESVFNDHFGVDHHVATEKIIKGKCDIGKEVHEILKWNNIDLNRLIDIINGKEDSFEGFFSGPINFDTIEGILRSYSYAKNYITTPKPDIVAFAAANREGDLQRQVVDTFWKYKDLVYLTIINSRKGILADAVSRKIMELNIDAFTENDFYIDEHALFRKLPALKKIILSRDFQKSAEEQIDFPIKYKERRFYIDGNFDFFSHQDNLRYRQTKEIRYLLPSPDISKDFYNLEGDLFDDDTI